MITAEEGAIQEVEDTIDCQEQLEQRRKLFDDLYLEYQGKEVFSGKDDQVTFELILDNLTDQGGLTGFGVFVLRMLEIIIFVSSSLKSHLKRKSARSIFLRKQEHQRQQRVRTSV